PVTQPCAKLSGISQLLVRKPRGMLECGQEVFPWEPDQNLGRYSEALLGEERSPMDPFLNRLGFELRTDCCVERGGLRAGPSRGGLRGEILRELQGVVLDVVGARLEIVVGW